MTKIEEIEQNINIWKASLRRDCDNGGDSYYVCYSFGVVQGLEQALDILKEPFNTVDGQTCSLDHKELRECGANYCIDCGQKLNNE